MRAGLLSWKIESALISTKCITIFQNKRENALKSITIAKIGALQQVNFLTHAGGGITYFKIDNAHIYIK